MHRVRDLPPTQFARLLDQITQEFESCLRAIELLNHDALEAILEQILEAFTLKIGQILQADCTRIFLVDEERQQLWSKIVPDSNQMQLELRLPMNTGIAGHVATTGQGLNIADAYSHPLFSPEIDRRTGYVTRNMLCMPVLDTRGRVVAIAQLLNKAGQPFDAQDEAKFEEFSGALGIILESCTSFYVAARNQRGAAALLNATTYLGQSLDLEKTLRAVMDEARKLMQADRSTLFLLDRERNELWSKVFKADGTTMVEIRLPISRGIAGFVASTGQTVNIPNAYEDPRFDPTADCTTGYRTRTILCMPVFNSEDKLIGVTQLINKYQGTFTRSDEEFMHAFNIQAGIALENAQLFERVLLEKQYQKDILGSLSDAVISTDLEGNIVTINDAALTLLHFPIETASPAEKEVWIQHFMGHPVWQLIPLETLQARLQDSLQTGARHYVPEQSLRIHPQSLLTSGDTPTEGGLLTTVLPDWQRGAIAHWIEHSVNLTVTPLTNPEGRVQGGLVVMEDISQEKRMKATMYRYMTPEVAERVMALGEDALMEGERREVTILFSDIRSYTSLTEKMEAVEVVALLNNYFETMVEAVFNFEGTLDKFIGDALMAVFGAPLPLPNHGWMAVQSALEMRQRLAEFNRRRLEKQQEPVRIGIGISSGEVVSGNIGSQKRMDYTVIGDGVNVSSRLEGVTKEYGCDIILSEFTYQLCQDRVWVRELDRIRVKGKSHPISIYELIGDRSQPLDDATEEFLDLYHRARQSYTQMDFERAIAYFGQAQQLWQRRGGWLPNSQDRAIAVHLERAHLYQLTPPPPNWDGVHTMTAK